MALDLICKRSPYNVISRFFVLVDKYGSVVRSDSTSKILIRYSLHFILNFKFRPSKREDDLFPAMFENSA